jgi:hypothetical protein
MHFYQGKNVFPNSRKVFGLCGRVSLSYQEKLSNCLSEKQQDVFSYSCDKGIRIATPVTSVTGSQ